MLRFSLALVLFALTPAALAQAPAATVDITEADSAEARSVEAARARAARLHDPAEWNAELFANTTRYARQMSAKSDLPLHIGAFPTLPYESPGNGSSEVTATVGGVTLRGHVALLGRGVGTEARFRDLAPADSGVASVVVLVAGGAPGSAYASSRNHPDYFAQGRVETDSLVVDWVSLALASAPDLAIVNTRMFDLRAGRVILVAPQPDATLRFFQADVGALAIDGFPAVGPELGARLDRPDVRAFLDAFANAH